MEWLGEMNAEEPNTQPSLGSLKHLSILHTHVFQLLTQTPWTNSQGTFVNLNYLFIQYSQHHHKYTQQGIEYH